MSKQTTRTECPEGCSVPDLAASVAKQTIESTEK